MFYKRVDTTFMDNVFGKTCKALRVESGIRSEILVAKKVDRRHKCNVLKYSPLWIAFFMKRYHCIVARITAQAVFHTRCIVFKDIILG